MRRTQSAPTPPRTPDSTTPRDPYHPTLAATTFESLQGFPPGGHWAESRRQWRHLSMSWLNGLSTRRQYFAKTDPLWYKRTARGSLTHSAECHAMWKQAGGRLP